MLDASEFRDLVSGRRRGFRAAFLRGLLQAAELPYTALVQARNLAYDRGWKPSHRVAAAVVSVGNLTMGGTGKTPMVRWLAEWFLARGLRVALVSRGYKATSAAINDEAMELAQNLPGLPHLQNPDRVAAARQAVAEHGAEVILLDDAFQHRRIQRDLDMVVVDALEPFGFQHVFPRGTLREPLRNLRRSDVVILSRSDAVSQQRRSELRQRLLSLAQQADWVEVTHQPARLRSSTGEGQPITLLEGQRVLAFCGIGNPAGFRHTLAACGIEIAHVMEFPDHHHYSEDDLQSLETWMQGHKDVAAVVCTHKDLVKIKRSEIASRPLWAIEIGISIQAGERALVERLNAVLE